MAQSNQSNLRGIPAFWSNHSMESPHSWIHWSDQLQLALIAKENLDIDNLTRPEVPENQVSILEQPTGSESDTEQASREATIRTATKSYEYTEEKRLKEEKNSKG